ncbi:MAG: BON domain-containing protein [Isosphaeraceae bacterium]|nr:BON domain-containing protein [Isosphaeraceae bacterium]
MKTDAELQADVLDELTWEPSVEAMEVVATVRDGVVTLTGRVPSAEQKQAAEQAVKRVAGVKGVANDLEVAPAGPAIPTDDEIARAAVRALEAKTEVPVGRVQVTVSDGRVLLEGSVDTDEQKQAAEEAVQDLVGVRAVENRIAIQPARRPLDVLARLMDAFRRNGGLDVRQLQAEVRGDRLILRGRVPSWAERAEAERLARATAGVAEVENHLAVID